MVPFIQHSQKDTTRGMEKISGCQRLSMEGGCVYGDTRGFLRGDGTVLYPDCGVVT